MPPFPSSDVVSQHGHTPHVTWSLLPPPLPDPTLLAKPRHPPFLQLRRRDESCRLTAGALHPALPPVAVILVYDFNHIASLKLQPCFLAGDQVVFSGIVVKLCPHEHLQNSQNGHAEWLNLVLSSSQPHAVSLGSACRASSRHKVPDPGGTPAPAAFQRPQVWIGRKMHKALGEAVGHEAAVGCAHE